AEFFAAPSGTPPITIAAGATMTIATFFQPTTIGSKSATITISDNAPGSPHTINLSGNAIGPHITLTPLSLGSNLEAQIVPILEVVAPSGGLPVTITSSDPSKLLVSQSATTVGSASVTITVPANQNGVATPYFVRPLARREAT